MSMIGTVPFEDGPNVQSMIRRLKNVKRQRRREKKNNARMQPELVHEWASSDAANEYENPGATDPKAQQASGSTTPSNDDLLDRNGNVRPDATILGENGERRNLKEIVDRMQSPNFKFARMDPNDPRLRNRASFEKEIMEREERKKTKGLPRLTHSDSESSTSSGGKNQAVAATNCERPAHQRDPECIDPDDQDPFDENGNIRPDATIPGPNGERRNLKELIDYIQGPDFDPVPVDPNDPSLRSVSSIKREIDEENRRKGIKTRTSSGSSTPPWEKNPALALTICERPAHPGDPGCTDTDNEDPYDENGNIRPDATIPGPNGERRNLKEVIAHIQSADFVPVLRDPNDPRLRNASSIKREIDEKNRRKGIKTRTLSDSEGSDSSSSTGYIPPPEERTPGGTRKWNYRDIQAGRLPLPGANKPMNGRPRINGDSSDPFPGRNRHVTGRPQVNGNPTDIRPRFGRTARPGQNEDDNIIPKDECWCGNCQPKERVDSPKPSYRNRRIDTFDHRQPLQPEPKKEIEIKLKLELGVDPVLLGVSGKKGDGHPINVSAPLSRPSQGVMERDDLDTTSPPPKTTSASFIQGLFARSLRIGGFFLIVVLAIMIGYMAGSNVCH